LLSQTQKNTASVNTLLHSNNMSSKTSKKQVAEQDKQVKVHRQDGKIMREKRAAVVPSDVNEENILPENATRRRNDFYYGKTTKDKNRLVARSKPRTSHNVIEQRADLPSVEKSSSSKKDSMKSVTTKVESMKLKKTKKQVQEEEEEEEEDQMEEVSEEEAAPVKEKESSKKKQAPVVEETPAPAPARKSDTQIRTRKSIPKAAPCLSEAVVKQLTRLGVTPATSVVRRVYSTQSQAMPVEIQLFLDSSFPANTKFRSEELDDTWEITEFDLSEDEKTSIFFENFKDYILIADGDRIVACSAAEACGDFPVYFIDFEGDTYDKSTLSEWLNTLAPVEAQADQEM